jgi:hypothetical protein
MSGGMKNLRQQPWLGTINLIGRSDTFTHGPPIPFRKILRIASLNRG